MEMIENRNKDLRDYTPCDLDRLFDDIPADTYIHSGGGSGKFVAKLGRRVHTPSKIKSAQGSESIYI